MSIKLFNSFNFNIRRKMRIGIMGAGIAGSYLYRLLKNETEHELEIHDKPHTNPCGINPCAWGTSKGFEDLVKEIGLNPDNYILMRHSRIKIDKETVRAYALTIDKPKLIRDMLGSAHVKLGTVIPDKFDLIVDATGVERAFLPSINGDITLPCVQTKAEIENTEMRIHISRIGYSWIFPISNKTAHIGAGSLVVKPADILSEMLPSGCKNICSCANRVRITSPSHSLPFTNGKVWGVGEAIGCVAPLAGEGIIPSMISAKILRHNLLDKDAYTSQILHEFEWMEAERDVVDDLNGGNMLNINNGMTLLKTVKRMGMDLNLLQALRILRKARK